MTDDAFFKRHRGGAGCVLLVTVYRTGEIVDQAVFSTREKVLEWLNTAYNDDGFSSMCAPYIVDEPTWGNEKVN